MAKAQRTSLVEWMARVGYAARGFVFLIVGILAALATSEGHCAVDSKGALRVVLAEPFGSLVLGAIVAGLLSFAAWRLMQAILDTDNCGNHPRGIARRLVQAVSALFYAGFGSIAASILFGWDTGESSDRLAHDWAAWLMGKQFGRWIIAGIGVAIATSGVGIAIAGWRADFQDHLMLVGKPKMLVTLLGVLGFMTRGLVFVLIGLFLIFAAVDFNPREAKGLAGTLQLIQGRSYGPWLLGFTAMGFLAFGLFSIAEAILRKINPVGPAMRAPVRQRNLVGGGF